MSNAELTQAPNETARLVVDTDVASYLFNWQSQFAPRYAEIVRGSTLVLSFMSVAEMRDGALHSKWGQRRHDLLESYLKEFEVLHSDDPLCETWAEVRSESRRKGQQIGHADAWIAATALVLSAPLVTNNEKHYRHLEGLEIITAA
jgi:predicted nucleic acid-binding protein